MKISRLIAFPNPFCSRFYSFLSSPISLRPFKFGFLPSVIPVVSGTMKVFRRIFSNEKNSVTASSSISKRHFRKLHQRDPHLSSNGTIEDRMPSSPFETLEKDSNRPTMNLPQPTYFKKAENPNQLTMSEIIKKYRHNLRQKQNLERKVHSLYVRALVSIRRKRQSSTLKDAKFKPKSNYSPLDLKTNENNNMDKEEDEEIKPKPFPGTSCCHDVRESIYNNHPKCVDYFFENQPEIIRSKETRFHLAASHRQSTQYLEYLLRNEPFSGENNGVNLKNGIGATPLHYACLYGSEKIVKLLIQSGANVNAFDKAGNTPLILSTAHKDIEIFRFLIEQAGADPTIKWEGKNLLHIAAMLGNTEMAQLALSHDIGINSITSNSKETPLHLCAQYSGAFMASFLLDNGADLALLDEDKNSPLFRAIESEKEDIVKVFVERGIDVNVPFSSGIYPLELAALLAVNRGYLDMVKVLVEQGNANFSLYGASRNQPILFMAVEHGDLAMIEYLLSEGADIESIDSFGSTVLFSAVESGNITILEFLTKHGMKDSYSLLDFSESPFPKKVQTYITSITAE